MTYQDTIREYRKRIRRAVSGTEPRLLLDFTDLPHSVALTRDAPAVIDVTTHSSAMPTFERLFPNPGGKLEIEVFDISPDFMHTLTKAFTNRTAVDVRVVMGVVLGQKVVTTYFDCLIAGYLTIAPVSGMMGAKLELIWSGALS